jgi:hypothetical protein
MKSKSLMFMSSSCDDLPFVSKFLTASESMKAFKLNNLKGYQYQSSKFTQNMRFSWKNA